MRLWVLILVLCACCICAMADPLPFRAGYNITNVTALSEASWRVHGMIQDTTYSTFDGYDAGVGNLVVCESRLGDIDVYLVTNIASASASTLAVDLVYCGTNAAPRIGQPTLGGAWICAQNGTNNIPTTGFFMNSGPSPYLRDGIAAIAISRLSLGTGGGSTTSGTVWIAGTNGLDANGFAISNVAPGVASNDAATVAQLTANLSYWKRNDDGEIVLKPRSERIFDVFWTTNSAGEVVLKK